MPTTLSHVPQHKPFWAQARPWAERSLGLLALLSALGVFAALGVQPAGPLPAERASACAQADPAAPARCAEPASR
jgi:hypothetical protein